MTDPLRHRGPDDKGTWCDASNGLALGHCRLSIIDLSAAGHQPMPGPSSTTHIVFNGEIYNYIELRRMLKADGVSLRTATDTEVILGLYDRFGVDCVRPLRGMFAFAIWDARKRQLFIARDRVGKKPLYYAAARRRLAFASELKGLRPVLERSESEIDDAALNRFLSFGLISGPRTIYRGVHQLPPGSMLIAAAPDRYQVRRYWDPGAYDDDRVPASVAEIEDVLTEAVRIRLRADVPVASFLSGGIDSGLITALASRAGPVASFTVGFSDSGFDERPLARLMARRFRTSHHEVLISRDVAHLLPRITQAYDQPFADPSAIPSFCVARAVSQHGFKVVLNGDGGDELFGGYRRALAAAWLSCLQRVVRPAVVRRVARTTLPLLACRAGSHRGRLAFVRRFLRGAAADDVRRILVWSTDSFTPEERRDLGMPAYDEAGDAEGLASYLPQRVRDSPLASMMAADFRWALPFGLLVKMDIATMAHGLEARSPFLDQELVSLQTAGLPLKSVPGLTTKPVLRTLARKYLPDEAVAAPKRGFEPPVLRWVTEELRIMRDDLLLSTDGLVATLVPRPRLERFLRRPTARDPARWANQVWILLSLAAWDRFINKEPARSSGFATLAAG